jgi:hypothetical protein
VQVELVVVLQVVGFKVVLQLLQVQHQLRLPVVEVVGVELKLLDNQEVQVVELVTVEVLLLFLVEREILLQ